MQEQFIKYLREGGNGKIYTPSTTYQYLRAVEKVCALECFSLEDLAQNIDCIIGRYERGGEDADFGETSHRTVINALYRFQEFVKDNQK